MSQGNSQPNINLKKIAGTATDTNSGNKSAGTLRVVLATDQPSNTNALKVDGSAVTQPVSGTVTINPLTNTSIVKAQLQDNAGTAITLGQKTMASSVPVVLSSDQTSIPVAATLSAETTKVIGTVNIAASQSVTVTQATGTNLHTVVDSGTITSITNALPSGTNVIGHVISDTGSTTAVTGNVTVVQPTNANLKADVTSNAANIATQATLALLPLAQASTTSGQSGPLMQAAVTTNAPTYTTGQTSPVSLTTLGTVREDIASVGGVAVTNSIGVPAQLTSINYPSSLSNQTSTQLAAGATFTGTPETVLLLQAAQVEITCDQPYTLYIDEFIDAAGLQLVSTDSFSRGAGVAYNENITLPGNYFRLRLTNNGWAPTTTLVVNVTFGIMATGPRTLTNLGNNRTSINEINGTTASTGGGLTDSGTLRVANAEDNINRINNKLMEQVYLQNYATYMNSISGSYGYEIR